MGNFGRGKVFTTIMKMEVTIWLSLALAVLTFTTRAEASQPRVVCYYTNWSVYRPGTARFNPQNINPYLCTHLIYAFGGFTKDNTLKPFDKYQDIEKGGYAKFTGLKTYNRELKTLLAIGGWNEGSSRFSPMVASRERRKEFVRNAIKFLRQNHFDGLDLDWEYPAFRDGGKPKDREHYAKLVKELREEFERESEKTGKPRLLLTMAVPAGIEYIQKGFDVKTLNRYLDWMNLLTYDYHSAFEPAVNHHAPLYPLEEPNEYSVDNELNIDYTIKFYLENGADADKLVLGIPTYGRSYTLFNPDAVEIGSPADGPGEQGDATREKGYLAYYEICEALKDKRPKRAISSDEEDEEDSEEEEEEQPWAVMHPNKEAMGPVAYRGNQWVGYDDIDIVQRKAEYVAENGLGGIMFWSIDNDDFRGTCHGKPYPLIEAAKEAYISKLGSTDNAVVSKKPEPANSGSKRRPRPRATTTARPSSTARAKINNRKSGSSSVKSTTPSWNIVTPEPPTTPDPGSDFKCTDEGFFPHPRDCKKYFWCLDSGPSNLGIVAHQFTCPSGLFFNKAADSCDFARNVLCKKSTTTTHAPTTRAASTTTTTTTTRRPIKISTKSSMLFRTTTTTTTTPEPEEEYEDEEEESVDVDAEDPKVIKELIDLIKKVGGIEQLEKQLHLSDSSSNGGTVTTTPSSFNKNLYKKVLERTIARKQLGSNSVYESAAQSRQRGPQNAGIATSADNDKQTRKDRPQYTTINRARGPAAPEPADVAEAAEEPPGRARAADETRGGGAARPLQYVNIRRARPAAGPAADTPDDSASRNALFERPASFVTVSNTPNTLDIQSGRRKNAPEYVTIRRQRPTTEESTSTQYQTTIREEDPQETLLEKEISSPSSIAQPQYTSTVRARSTTAPPPEEPEGPEPTTVLSVQISSLLNSPEAETSPEPEAPTTEFTEPSATTTMSTTSTSSSTTSPSTATSSRRPTLRRRGSTSTTSTTAATPTTQVSSRNYTFVRRRRPLARPNEITSDSDDTVELTRKIRSTTPDSREVDGVKADSETGPTRRFRSRFRPTTDDSVPAEASTVPRGQFRPSIGQDELISLTPIDVDTDVPTFVPRQSFVPRRFRGRTSSTAADKALDSEVSAATLDVRPSILPRGRSRFTVSTTTETINASSEAPLVPRRPAFTKFTPRPFTRSTTSSLPDEDIKENVDEVITKRGPSRLPFGRVRPSTSTAQPTFQAQRVSFPSRQTTTPQTMTSDIDEEEQDKNEDITLSESAIEEKEHQDFNEEEAVEVPKNRIVIKRLRIPSSSTTESTISTETIPINDSGKRKFRVIRRRPTSTSVAPEERSLSDTPRNKIRKVIRKKILPVEEEPEIIAKSISSLNTQNKDTSTEIITNYGEKTRPSVILPTTEASLTTPAAPEKQKSESKTETEIQNVDNEPVEQEKNKHSEESLIGKPQTNQNNKKGDTSEEENDNEDSKPEVIIETSQPGISLSENENQPSIELTSESPSTETEVSSPETTTASTTQPTSPSSRSRAPYRPPKRLFTSTTESASPLSSRSFSRKFNPGVYTSPATVERDSFKSSSRRPFSSRTFSRRPFTTSSTTPEPEDEEYSEELLDEEPENELVLVPPSKLFTRKPNSNDDDFQDSEEVSEDEISDEETPSSTSRKPYKPKIVNSNTFRTSTSTTELPKRYGSSQNRTSIYNRSSPNKPVDLKANRVQNVPVGYNKNIPSPATQASAGKNVTSETTENNTEELTTTTTTYDSNNDFDMSTGDDYLSMTDTPGTTVTDKDETLSTNTIESNTVTAEMEIDNSTDDFLEYTEQTTNYPSTHDSTLNTQTETENEDHITEVTTEITPEITLAPTIPPVIKTQFDKLFSVSRVVEVSSKLDKHRLNKNNESRLIEEGKIMVEKKPVVDKIGEVSRFSLIKIFEDEIPIYLTKYGHIYPVENPPDNTIRIDEGRNARALGNFADGPRENLVASESINEAYRHVTKETNKANSDMPKHRVEHIQSDDFLSFINDDKKSDNSSENSYAQWQFVPAAYENEHNKLNKAAKSFEIITPRSMLTDPSTLPVEALFKSFKTENPVMAKKITDDTSSQPFVVYSAPVPSQNEEANIVKLEVSKPEVGRSIVTYAKGQEFQGASVDQSTIQYPINISILPKTSTTPSTTTTILTTSTTEKVITSPIVEMLTTLQSTTLTTAALTVTATEALSTTETILDEITTAKINPLDAKRKFAFPRRPIIKPSNFTRVNPISRVSKSNATVVSNNLKSNKTSGFNPTKSRFTANRSQNVPVDLRNKTNSHKVTPKVTTRSFTTEVPRTTTERKLYFKPIRPNLRPAFVPRKSTTPKSPKDRRKPFLRRTKATAPPDTTDTETESIDTETTTNKYTRRGNSKFKSRKEAALSAGRKQLPKKNEIENGTQRSSLSSVVARSERPTRNFLRRRLGGANVTTPSPAPRPSSSPAPSSVSATSRRPFRIASRRRPAASSTSTSTTTSSTLGLASEESLQDIGDTDSIEDPALTPRVTPKSTVKIQRRPLVSLKEEARDQNPSATNEEERKRQSKKYSSSIKQNQLDELKKSKSQETTTAGSTTAEDYSAETAVAVAAYQLLNAPIPNIPNYDEEPQSTTKSQPQTTVQYSYTPQYTESKTIYSEDFSTPNYEFSSLRTRELPTSTGTYEPTTSYIPKTKYPTTTFSTPGVYLTTASRAPLSTSSVSSQSLGGQNLGPSTARYLGASDKYVGVPVEEYAYSTAGYTGQEPSYFTREYLLESPVTKTYDDEYQYLSPVTTPQTASTSPRKTQILRKKISTTQPPTLAPPTRAPPTRAPPTLAPPTLAPPTTPRPRVPSRKVQKPFEKVQKPLPNRTYRPIDNYDYYDDSAERMADKYGDGTKVVLHEKGTIECLDIGNFPHPSSCKKFISCARIENGSLLGWEYICPKGLSFDPVGGICNWSAGLGCDEHGA